jgi:hypothetical protein
MVCAHEAKPGILVHLDLAFCRLNHQHDARRVGFADVGFDRGTVQNAAQFVGLWRLESQRLHRTELRRIQRWMRRALSPLNEKRNQGRALLDVEHLPPKQLAVRTLPGAGLRPSGFDAGGFGRMLGGGDVLSVDRPSDDAMRRKLP